jgi:TonB family protein
VQFEELSSDESMHRSSLMKNLIDFKSPAFESKFDSSQSSSGGFLVYLDKVMHKEPDSMVVVREVLIPKRSSPWSAFGLAVVLQLLTVAVLMSAPILFPEKFDAVRRYFVMTLTSDRDLKSPRLPSYKRRALHLKSQEVASVSPGETAEPAPAPTKVYSPIASSPLTRLHPNAHMGVDAPSIPLREALSSNNLPPPLFGLSIPALKRPREGVVSGGFDVGENSTETGKDVGGGTSKGNVANGAFSQGTPGGAGRGAETGSGVRQGLFVDEHTSAVARRASPFLPVSASTAPVRILEKPKPSYTAEARAQRIEGEVLLQVVFTASGKVRVIRVVRGLGYGLDGSAQEAAQRIKFAPALADGQPVDSSAIVHIDFELAY